MKYVTKMTADQEVLDKIVNELLEEGWELYGSPNVASISGFNKMLFIQTMIKHDKKTKTPPKFKTAYTSTDGWGTNSNGSSKPPPNKKIVNWP